MGADACAITPPHAPLRSQVKTNNRWTRRLWQPLITPPEVPAPSAAPKVIRSAAERFPAVADFNTYRLRDRRSTYGTKKARKMRWTAKDMKHSFGAESFFTGKTPHKTFT